MLMLAFYRICLKRAEGLHIYLYSLASTGNRTQATWIGGICLNHQTMLSPTHVSSRKINLVQIDSFFLSFWNKEFDALYDIHK